MSRQRNGKRSSYVYIGRRRFAIRTSTKKNLRDKRQLNELLCENNIYNGTNYDLEMQNSNSVTATHSGVITAKKAKKRNILIILEHFGTF
jgi:hypothetical protein